MSGCRVRLDRYVWHWVRGEPRDVGLRISCADIGLFQPKVEGRSEASGLPSETKGLGAGGGEMGGAACIPFA